MTPSKDFTFSQVLERAREGDDDAREELFERLASEEGEEGAQLLAMARRLLSSDDRLRDYVESRDLVQSALRSGWIDLSDFRGDTPRQFLAWMRSILRNKLAQVVRRKRPRPTGTGAGLQEDSRTQHDEPLAGLLRREVALRVRAAVSTLPDGEREVMELKLRGLRSPDIAVMLGLRPDAVRKRESRAAARLRGVLKEFLADTSRIRRPEEGEPD